MNCADSTPMPAAIGALSRGYTGQMKAATVVILAVLGTAPMVVSSQEPARELLERAITAAGGAENLQRHSVFAWHGDGAVHAAGGQVIKIAGEWRVEPPDRAVVDTYVVEQGQARRGRWASTTGEAGGASPALNSRWTPLRWPTSAISSTSITCFASCRFSTPATR